MSIRIVLGYVLLFAMAVSAISGHKQQSFSVRPSPVFKLRLTSEQYNRLAGELLMEGYRLTYISGYTINDIPQFAAIWDWSSQSTNTSQIIKLGLNSSQYQIEFDNIVSKGYRLTLINGYTVNNSDLYVAIWESTPSTAWVSKYRMNVAELQTTFNDLVAKGYRATHLCGYAIGNEAHYAAILEKRIGPLWAAWAGMTTGMFQERSDVLRAHGYRVVDLNGYGVNGLDFYAAIWEYHDGRVGQWIERHGMIHRECEVELVKNREAGYIVKVLGGYTVNGTDLYSALWVKDESGPS
jgi:Bacterial tandem repeat domain 1